MTSKLQESEFLSVDIRSLFKKRTDDPTEQNSASSEAEMPAEARPTSLEAWGELLNKRLSDNRKLSQEARKPEYEIESKFFNEFFNANWDAECAKQLILLGDTLKKIIRKIGFNEKTNPILAFIRLDVIKKLLREKKLDINSFKVIIKACINKEIVDSQFLGGNALKYNIIYCADLYSKSAKEIAEYIKLQSEILSKDLSKYTTEVQEKNRKIFFKTKVDGPDIKELVKNLRTLQPNDIPSSNEGAILNPIETIKALLTNFGITSDDGREIKFNSEQLKNIADKLDSPAKKVAAIMMLGMSTASDEAKVALSNKNLKNNINTDELLQAALTVAAIIPKGKIAKKDADLLVKILTS